MPFERNWRLQKGTCTLEGIGWAPVTVCEFARFTQSKDFKNPAVWNDMPIEVHRGRDATLINRLRGQLRHPNWPVVYVGVAEAIAYCRWRTLVRDDGRIVRLPSEAELKLMSPLVRKWTKSVDRPRELTDWPLSDLHPSPIGTFSSANGLADLIGGVWQWAIGSAKTDEASKDDPLNVSRFLAFGGYWGYRTTPRHFASRVALQVQMDGFTTVGFRCFLAKSDIALSSADFAARDTYAKNHSVKES